MRSPAIRRSTSPSTLWAGLPNGRRTTHGFTGILLGYIYEEKGRPGEAVPEFKRATELDPDYLNAWAHLAETATGIDDALAGQAGLALGRLDPSGFHRESRFEAVEPAEFWRVIHDALPTTYLMPRDLMPLHSAPPTNNQMFRSQQREADWPQVGRNGNGENVPWRIPITASLRVSELNIVTSIASLLSFDEQDRGGMGGFGGG